MAILYRKSANYKYTCVVMFKYTDYVKHTLATAINAHFPRNTCLNYLTIWDCIFKCIQVIASNLYRA